jgi:glucosamine 6-phosphate synthetase-like amidotransferase/phosphosugar isomerase protein
MCGIFGLLTNKSSNYSDKTIKKIIDTLFILSESRGKEASGFAIKKDNKIFVFKQPIPASKLIKLKKYKELIQQSLSSDGNTIDNKGTSNSLAIIGHSRLVTDGIQDLNVNNQPVIKDGAVAIHNGIIVNNEELWGHFTNMRRIYEVDTEVLLSMLQMFRKEKKSIIVATQETFFHIEG